MCAPRFASTRAPVDNLDEWGRRSSISLSADWRTSIAIDAPIKAAPPVPTATQPSVDE